MFSRRIVTSVVVKAAKSCRFVHKLTGTFPWMSDNSGGDLESAIVYGKHKNQRNKMKLNEARNRGSELK